MGDRAFVYLQWRDKVTPLLMAIAINQGTRRGTRALPEVLQRKEMGVATTVYLLLKPQLSKFFHVVLYPSWLRGYVLFGEW